MRNRLGLLLSVAVLALLAWMTGADAAPPARRHVLVISVDGMKPEYLLDPKYAQVRIPALRRLLAEGSHARALQPVLPSVTYPNHTTMVTGVRPLLHGIGSNKRNDWRGKHVGEWFWYAREIQARTIWQAVREAGGTVATLEWPVTVGAAVDFNIPQYWRYGYPDDLRILNALSTPPDLLARGNPRLPGEGEPRLGKVEAALAYDECIARCAAHLLETSKPTLTMVGLAALDEAQHEHGPGSPEALATLERLDAIIGALVQKVHPGASSTERYAIVVLSDHGFAPVSRSLNMRVLLKKEGLDDEVLSSPICGFNPFYLRRSAGPAAAMLLRAFLERQVQDKSLGLARLWSRADLDAQGAFPGAIMALESQDGTMFGSNVDGPVVTMRPEKGSHGYDPNRPDQQASLLVAGDGIRPGVVLPQARMIDVAPTLAALLGVSMPGVEGRALSEFLAEGAIRARADHPASRHMMQSPGLGRRGTPQRNVTPETHAKGLQR